MQRLETMEKYNGSPVEFAHKTVGVSSTVFANSYKNNANQTKPRVVEMHPKSDRNARSHERSTTKEYKRQDSKPTYQRQMSYAPVENLADLETLDKFESLSPSDKKFEMISKYVNNSHGLKDAQGNLIIHNIFEINNDDWTSFQESLSSFNEPDSKKMLLWYKTTTKGVQKLVEGRDSCIVFYDRMCRAFPENPRNVQNPLRQLILLCAVSMGNVYESLQGFCHWSMRGSPPSEHDSVKGIGKSIPNWNENAEDESFIVPCGQTIQNQLGDAHKLEFSEYIIFDVDRIKVKYAVDVEVIPSLLRRQASYGAAT